MHDFVIITGTQKGGGGGLTDDGAWSKTVAEPFRNVNAASGIPGLV